MMENWEQYYRDEIENQPIIDGDGTTPTDIDFEAPILERYNQTLKYRIHLYRDPKYMTELFYKFEQICSNYKFPLFFLLDFEVYQRAKNWEMNGKPIKNYEGAFYKYSLNKKKRMIEQGSWNGANIENYEYCGAWEYRAYRTNHHKKRT